MDGMNETPSVEEANLLDQIRDEEWRDRRNHMLFKLKSSMSREKSLLDKDMHQSKVLGSLVPDEIIYMVNDYSHRHYDACLLFGDVSGFTDLCEKYNKTGKGGPSRLTQVLNAYIGSMVQEIISHNGDVLKFSGDAFLAMWKSDANNSMQDAVHDALDCALIIQKSYGTYETDVGVFLRVKLAISAGHVVFSIIGDEKTSHYVVVGQPIWDVKAAEHKSSAGEIIVSHTAWNYINPSEYIYEIMNDGLHIKVLGLGASWRSTQRGYRQDAVGTSEENILDESDEDDNRSVQDDFSIRPSVDWAARMQLTEDLRKFIIPPVMRSVDMKEPLEYLTEMRHIVIVFINVVTHKIDLTDFVNLVNRCYKIVCGIVERMEGCVNKVSLFDKDLMFVVIFGFRGFKHELESQIGLMCATECYHNLALVKYVKSTSIGVTTGLTYCGVVGHTLRREYTVISLNVNKAARLMVAYPNKVTCDRETFLRSKMEARHFILQEQKHLKGISQVGCVYEFKMIDVEHDFFSTSVSRYPILGRDAELRLYFEMLSNCAEKNLASNSRENVDWTTCLHMKGEARQGMTRLMDEIVYITPSSIPINRFTLCKKFKRISYHTIREIFSLTLDIKDTSTQQDRQDKVQRRMKDVSVPELLCVLNNIFNVGFHISDLYRSLNNEQKQMALRKTIKLLTYYCFKHLWLVAIDEGGYVDEESWPLLNEMFKTGKVFFVINTTKQEVLSESGVKVMSNRNVRSLKLAGIDKWFVSGLACQILEVFAIPVELEKSIQMRGNGNPGWIENYLLSLVQGGGVVIKNVEKSDVNQLGLVVPPVEMLERKSPDELREQLKLNESSCTKLSHFAEINAFDVIPKTYGWKMYKYAYRDSMTTGKAVNQFSFIERVPVCFISPTGNVEDVDPDLPMDVFIMKTFDSLTSDEQMVVKCGAVLGNFFTREMLMYIMGQTTKRGMALAVQKLFERHVLSCAQGDFTQGDTSVVFSKRLVNPNKNMAVKCECKGLKVYETCLNLPKYASCGYMRFRLELFRKTMYNLLTDNQKKEFHGRAVRYIEKETRKCRSCGNGFFVRILGSRSDDLKAKVVKKSGKTTKQRMSDSSVTSSVQMHMRRHSMQSDSVSREGISLGSVSVESRFRKNIEIADQHRFWNLMRFKSLRNDHMLTRTFSNSDFTNCQCKAILSTMYSQMVEHCNGAGYLEKLNECMIEFAYLCIVSYNIPQAMKILDEAYHFVKTKPLSEDEENQEWRIPLMCGKIKTLMGYARLELGQIKEASECFYEAMTLYGYPFPTKNSTIRMRTKCLEFKQYLGVYFCRWMVRSNLDGYDAEFCDNVSECLALMCSMFQQLGQWDKAELSAAWSLAKVLMSEMDFYKMCTAYSNMIHVSQRKDKNSLCIGLEVEALRLCHKKRSSVESQELIAVSKMYAAIFFCRIQRAEIENAINIGYVLLRMTQTVHYTNLSLRVFPLLVHMLLYRKQLMEVVTLLNELEYYAEEDIDSSGKAWFYALTVTIHLETGYTVVPFKNAEKFNLHEGEALITVRDPSAERRYFTVMWLWSIRCQEWEAATLWYIKAKDFSITDHDSYLNLCTALYLLEGLILFLICKMDKRNLADVTGAYHDINNLVKLLEKATQRNKILLPRFLLLKAYFKYARDPDSSSSALNILANAKKIAEKQQNLLDFAWLEHTEKAWNNTLPSILTDLWRDYCDTDNNMDYHEFDFNGGKLTFFTLPTPLYI